MPEPQVDAKFLEGLYQAMRRRAADLAPHFKPGYDAKELTEDELETVWNRRFLTLEEEWALWRERNPDGTPKHTPEMIGRMVFQQREPLAKAGGRIEPKEQIGWVNQTAQRMARKRAERQAALEAQGGIEQPAETVGPAEGMV